MANEYTLKIKEVLHRTYNVKSVRLRTDENIEYKAGQFLNACLVQERECRRYLSISSSPTEKGYIEFTKKITESDFSRMLEAAVPGDTVKVQMPFGNFTLQDPQVKIAFLSGGIGVTPIRSICKSVVDQKLGTDMVLINANRSIRDIVFKEDFDGMQKYYPKLKVAHVLCESAPNFKCTVGLINTQIIKNEIPDYNERKFFICGPPPMVESMQKILTEEMSLAKENIITENFTGY
ncbi:MAG: FAD-dependent oxidoreductase [Candidatus Omnitrophota bacterium]